MPIVLSQLKTELNTDPRGYGYAARITAGDIVAVAAMLNHRRDGTAPPNPTGGSYGAAGQVIVIGRNDVTGDEILDGLPTGSDFVSGQTALLAAHYESITQSPRSKRLYTGVGQTSAALTPTNTLTFLRSVVATNSASRANWDALGFRNGSRAEELFGVGTSVNNGTVSDALNS